MNMQTVRKPENIIEFSGSDVRSCVGKGCIHHEGNAITFDVVPYISVNPKAPTHRLFRKDVMGFNREIGGIWKSVNRKGEPKWTLTMRDPDIKANLAPVADSPQIWAALIWQLKS